MKTWSAILLGVWMAGSGLAPAQGLKAIVDAVAQPTKSPAKPEDPSMPDQLAWTKTQLAASQQLLDESKIKSLKASLATAGLPDSRMEDYRSAVREVQRLYQNAADTLEALIRQDGEKPQPAPLAVPGNELEAAELRESLRRAQLAAKSSREEVELINVLLAQKQGLASTAEREIRQFGEEETSARTEEARARATLQIELARLQKQVADAWIFYGKWRAFQQLSIQKKAEAQVAAIRLALHEGGFDRQLNADRATSQINSLNRNAADLEKKLSAAERMRASSLDANKKYSEVGGATGAQADQRQAAAELLLDAAQGLHSILQDSLALIDLEKSHWQTVKSLSASQDHGAMRAAVAHSESIIARLAGWRPLAERKLLESREGLDAAQKKLKDAAGDPVLKDLCQRAMDLYQQRASATGALISRAEQFAALNNEFLDELETLDKGSDAKRKLARDWDQFKSFVHGIWTFELFHTTDNSITVGKVLLAVLGLFLSVRLSGQLARWASRAAARNFRMAFPQQILLEKILFLPAVAIFVLTLLNWLNIPLTIFAFFGGALAIGVGFGAQNLVNNFISGLILLLERQIKVGDVIEVGPRLGKITHLGSRCSRLRTFDGVEVLIPNSSFLEKEVTNWTLADTQHRYDFTLGVAYGSPVESVITLLETALHKQPEILKDPAPGVFFESFGDSSLTFRIYYWLEIGGDVDPRKVGSQLRCRIDSDFRRAGVEMPFPQRDLHIRSASPIPVQIYPPPAN